MFISLLLSGGVCIIFHSIYNVSLYSSASGISNGIPNGISYGISNGISNGIPDGIFNGISDGIFIVIPSEILMIFFTVYLYSVPTVLCDK